MAKIHTKPAYYCYIDSYMTLCMCVASCTVTSHYVNINYSTQTRSYKTQ